MDEVKAFRRESLDEQERTCVLFPSSIQVSSNPSNSARNLGSSDLLDDLEIWEILGTRNSATLSRKPKISATPRGAPCVSNHASHTLKNPKFLSRRIKSQELDIACFGPICSPCRALPDQLRPLRDASDIQLPRVSSFFRFEIGFEWLNQASVTAQNSDLDGEARSSSTALLLATPLLTTLPMGSEERIAGIHSDSRRWNWRLTRKC